MSFDEDHGWVAHVDHNSFGRNAKLLLAQRRPNALDVLRITEEGVVFTTVEEGVTMPDDAGIELPLAALNAIAKAIQAFQGDTGHAATEARVLREWLKSEQARVDDVLARVPR